MKITKVESFLMSYALPEPLRLRFYGGQRTILKRDAMLIRVSSDNGLRGYAPGPAHETAAVHITEEVGPFLLGKNPLDWRTWKAPAEHSAKSFAAVLIAVADLAARYEGAPLSEVIGGRRRDRIKLYGSAGMYMTPEGYASEAAAIAGLGFKAYKMRPAAGPQTDLETIACMRRAVGPEVGLMIDAHSWWRMGDKSYSPETVAMLASEMKAYAPVWLEEPLAPADHAAYRALRRKQLLPLAAGEHEQDLAGFNDLANSGAVDYLQMDVCCQGGIEMAKQVFESVRRNHLRFAFHSWGTALEVLAAAHLGICWDDTVVEWLEYPCYRNSGRPGMYPFPLADEILSEPLNIENGELVVPKTPGLGIEIDERVLNQYPFIPGPWSWFRIDCPAETIAVTGDHSVKWVESGSRP